MTPSVVERLREVERDLRALVAHQPHGAVVYAQGVSLTELSEMADVLAAIRDDVRACAEDVRKGDFYAHLAARLAAPEET